MTTGPDTARIGVAMRLQNIVRVSAAASVFAISLSNAVNAQSVSAAPIINVGSRTKGVPAITLKQPAALHVGGVLDDPADEFDHRNSFLLAEPLSDGGLAVVDRIKIRIYDKRGKPRVVLGGVAGSGPNEYKGLWRVCRTRGDTLFVHDDQNSRLTVLTASGKIVAATSTRGVRLTRSSCLEDGTIIVTHATADSAGFEMAFFLRRNTDGSDAAPIGEFPISYKVPGPVPYVTIGRGHEFIVADPNVSDIAIRDLTGKVRRIYRLAEQPSTAFADVALQSTVTAAMGIGTEQAGKSNAGAKSGRVPWPLYKRIEVDSSGNLWLQDMTVKATEKQSWTRINTKGAVSGRLELAPQFVVKTQERTEVMAFTSDGVLIRSFDAEGAAHFYRYTFN